MHVAYVVPAYQAQGSIGGVVAGLVETRQALERRGHRFVAVIVVDDGSGDATTQQAQRHGAVVLGHSNNRGKGAALLTGLREAERLGAEVAVSVDADGQHPADAALVLALDAAPAEALVLGVRDARSAGAPRLNRASNRIANVLLDFFAGYPFQDTQCGLRRYPVAPTLALGVQSGRFAFEAELLLRAVRAGWQFVQVPVQVRYPPAAERVSHFHAVRDPWRIVVAVLRTLWQLRLVDKPR